MYKVIESFADLHDDNHVYQVGDVFPREGVEVSEDRIRELATSANKLHMPLIAQTGYIDKAQLEAMKVFELKKLAADFGLNPNQKKAELVEALSAIEVITG